jgi:SAM-dependent methyltransferase
MGDTIDIFDPAAVRRHRARAAPNLASHDFLLREITERLAGRLDDVRREFPVALDLGPHAALADGHRGIGRVLRCDALPGHGPVTADEALLPFADASFDLAVSLLSLHWVNDLPGALVQLRRALKPDGLLLAAMFGGDTLGELRASWAAAEIAEEGGVSPRVAPLVELRDAGALLQRAGFALPVVDLDSITVSYPDAFALMRDLRGMGETNAAHERRKRFTRRATLMAMAEHYHATYADDDGRVPATFQIVYLTGWAPDASQQKSLAPGSARARLADALDAEERPAGDKTSP